MKNCDRTIVLERDSSTNYHHTFLQFFFLVSIYTRLAYPYFVLAIIHCIPGAPFVTLTNIAFVTKEQFQQKHARTSGEERGKDRRNGSVKTDRFILRYMSPLSSRTLRGSDQLLF